MSYEELKDRVLEMLADRQKKNKRWTFSLEYGRGETYYSGKPTLYGHSEYERSSVLAGRPQRVFVHQWNAGEEPRAREELGLLCQQLKAFAYDDMCETGGTSHIPVEQLVSHLPDDTDY